jgi:adiponectin receptor
MQARPTVDIGRTTATINRRIHRRRLSSPAFFRTSFAPKFPHALPCKPLPTSVEALDLSGSSPFQKLASLRVVLLSYLEALEKRLAELSESSLSDMYTKGEDTVDEWARTGLTMLESIRAEVTSHLPEVHSTEEIPPSVEEFVRTHFMDLRSLPTMLEWDADMLPDLASTASSMKERLDFARSRFTEMDLPTPTGYMSRLSERLHSLHDHLSSMDIMPSLASSPMLESVLGSDKIRGFLEETSTAVTEFIEETSNVVSEGEIMLERAALDIANAVKRSLDGTQLIHYVDLPDAWKSNPFITQGYRYVHMLCIHLNVVSDFLFVRFIPLRRWPLILMSLFALHNETCSLFTVLFYSCVHLIAVSSQYPHSFHSIYCLGP